MSEKHTADMDADRSDVIIVRTRTDAGQEERTRYEPRSDGGYVAVEEFWTGDEWHTRGTESVEFVAITTPEDRDA